VAFSAPNKQTHQIFFNQAKVRLSFFRPLLIMDEKRITKIDHRHDEVIKYKNTMNNRRATMMMHINRQTSSSP